MRARGRLGARAHGGSLLETGAELPVGRRSVGLALAILLCAGVPKRVCAQDSVPGGVRIGITYTPGRRPALAVARTVASSPLLDSVVAIVTRDLEQSDRFEVVRSRSPEAGDTTAARVLAAVVRTRLADALVVVEQDQGGSRLIAFDVVAGREAARFSLTDAASPEGRRAVHAVSDAVVDVLLGESGIASTRLLFVQGGRLYVVDADGHGLLPAGSAGNPALSPAWSPDGRRIAYTAFVRSGQPIVLQDLVTGRREVVPRTEYGMNITPVFSPDGRKLAFARGTAEGTDLYLYDMARGSLERLTTGRYADNLSPAWSPDGTRLAFISTRARTPQLYVMNSDGTGQELLARFDFGATGSTSSPSWSPDGEFIAFHRVVAGAPQLFVLQVSTGAMRQLTGSGRNEDPSWAPDSRHLAFSSTRTGARELWVLDVESGRLRQVTFTAGGARLPAWSPRLTSARR